MISHRMSTHSAFEPPTRFYKLIAMAFIILTAILLAVVVFITSSKAEIIVIGKKDSESVSMAVNIHSRMDTKTGGVFGSVSSTMFYWSEKFYPTGNKKVESVAKGEVIIYNKSGVEQPLVKTTRLLTPNNIMFRLSENVTVPANGEIVVPVYADQSGAASEIAPSQFVIPGLKTDRQKFVYAESKKTMVGGVQTVGILGEDDIRNAEKSFKEKLKENFLNKFPAGEGEEKIVEVIEQGSVVVGNKVGDEVAEFSLTGTSTVVTVVYKTDDLADLISKEIESKIDTSVEKFLSLANRPQVSVAGYSLKEGTAELSVRQDAVVTLDANLDKLAAQNFTGKKKDEIQRYVLGLDHVSGVEVKFSPSWMLSAPSVPDKIRVVVKNLD